MKSAITELYLLNKSNVDKSTIEFTIPDYCPKCHAPFVHNFSKAITTDEKKVEIFMYCNHCSSFSIHHSFYSLKTVKLMLKKYHQELLED